MRNFIQLPVLICLMFSAFMITAGTPDQISEKQKISFTENKGQVYDQYRSPRPDVLFGGSSPGFVYHLLKDGINYQLQKINYEKSAGRNHFHKKHLPKINSVDYARVEIKWLNCNRNAEISTTQLFPGEANYINASGTIDHVKTYGSVLYYDLYEKTDLHYYEKAGQLKYDFIVRPGGDYHTIQLQVNGAKKIRLTARGTLIFETALGKIEEGAPIVFQGGRQLAAKWLLKDNILGFEITGANNSQDLIIDPTTRAWGTYYGDTGDDAFFYCAADASSNLYAVGASSAASGTIIASSGSYQSSFGGGNYDALIVKFNSSGQRIWATYYGGSGDEALQGCAVDPSGDLLVVGVCDGASGTTLSDPAAFQPAYGGGPADVCLAKFSSAGIRLWATYYGDAGDDESISVACDANGNVYVCGYTDSPASTIIATPMAHQTTFGGFGDGFLVKFSAAGLRLWGTYYGDTDDDWFAIAAVDPSGNIYCSGATSSTAGIATSGAHQVALTGNYDALLVKFNSAGTRLWGTYYGGFNDDLGFGCATDGSGNVYMAGDTESPAFISTPGSHQTNYAGGQGDAFAVKFNGSGSRLWATYYGGSSYDENYTCATDAAGNFYISGGTMTGNGTGIASPLNHQSTFGGGNGEDAYLARFNSNGVRHWGTYYGGNDDEIAYLCTAPNTDIYIVGYSASTNMISTVGSWQINPSGSYDCYAARFNACTPPAAPSSTTPASALKVCANKTSSIVTVSSGTVVWYNAASGGTVVSTGNTFTFGLQPPGTYSVYAESQECAVSLARNFIVYTVSAAPQLSITGIKANICAGESQTVMIAGASTYTWLGGLGSNTRIIVAPNTATQYVVIGTVGTCTDQATYSQMVQACVGINEVNAISDLRLYPNPAKNEFFLDTGSPGKVEVINATGQLIMTVQVSEGINKFSPDLIRGIYFVRFSAGAEEKILKLIVE